MGDERTEDPYSWLNHPELAKAPGVHEGKVTKPCGCTRDDYSSSHDSQHPGEYENDYGEWERCGWCDGEGWRYADDGADLIAAERRRQIDAEGWTPEHDDRHVMGEMLMAATSYQSIAQASIVATALGSEFDAANQPPTSIWPWHPEWWKPSDDPVRNLVRAGALIAAEIDRLQRAAAPARPASPEGGKA